MADLLAFLNSLSVTGAATLLAAFLGGLVTLTAWVSSVLRERRAVTKPIEGMQGAVEDVQHEMGSIRRDVERMTRDLDRLDAKFTRLNELMIEYLSNRTK